MIERRCRWIWRVARFRALRSAAVGCLVDFFAFFSMRIMVVPFLVLGPLSAGNAGREGNQRARKIDVG